MKSLNVCFSTSNKLLSRIIRWVTKSDVSHALITFYDETMGKVFVLEANGKGYILTPWAKWRQKHTLVCRYELAIPVQEQEKALRYMADYLGSQYDFMSLIGFLWMRFMKRIRNPLDDPTRLVCSEAVAMLLHRTGNKLFEIFYNYSSWDPGALVSAADRMEAFVLREDSRYRLPSEPSATG